MITLTQLEYIVALDTHRHFVTAAEQCNVTQPTLSMQVKKLENFLGILIFDRSKQPFVPTAIGKKVISQARVVMAESKRISDIISNEQTILEGSLSVAVIPSLAPYLLPLFIGSFNAKYPHIHLKIKELLTEEIIEELKIGMIDIGILVTPLKEHGIIEKPLFYEEILLYVNQNHPFANKKIVNTNEIGTPDLWLLSKGHCFRSQVINLCSYTMDKQESFHFEYESGSLETLKRFVEMEGGFTLLPELAAKNLSSKNAKIRNFKLTKPLREVGLVYSNTFSKTKIIDAFSNSILEAIPTKLQNKERGVVVEWK
jgi:LysR family hydrogen peroxide-inducible transcriptional activator